MDTLNGAFVQEQHEAEETGYEYSWIYFLDNQGEVAFINIDNEHFGADKFTDGVNYYYSLYDTVNALSAQYHAKCRRIMRTDDEPLSIYSRAYKTRLD